MIYLGSWGAADGLLGVQLDDELLAHRNVDLLAQREIAHRERSCRNYKSEKLSIAIETVLINATESYQEAPKDYGWNDLLSRKPRIYDVKADHFSLIEKIAVKDVAKKITAALEKK